MACNFSQLRRRQSSGSLNKAKTDEDFKDQFYRSVSSSGEKNFIDRRRILSLSETSESLTEYREVRGRQR